jgi:hypothetical protein
MVSLASHSTCPPSSIHHAYIQLTTAVQQLSGAADGAGASGNMPLQKGFSTGEQFTPLKMRVRELSRARV